VLLCCYLVSAYDFDIKMHSWAAGRAWLNHRPCPACSTGFLHVAGLSNVSTVGRMQLQSSLFLHCQENKFKFNKCLGIKYKTILDLQCAEETCPKLANNCVGPTCKALGLPAAVPWLWQVTSELRDAAVVEVKLWHEDATWIAGTTCKKCSIALWLCTFLFPHLLEVGRSAVQPKYAINYCNLQGSRRA